MRDRDDAHLIGRARLLRREGKTYDEIRAAIGAATDDELRRWLKGIPRPPATRRSHSQPEVRRTARQLRATGITYEEIREVTGASVGSLNLWLAEMPLERFAPRSRQTRRQQETCASRRVQRLAARDVAIQDASTDVGELTGRDLFFVGLALYWAEGAKSKPWRLGDRVKFINSDPTVIRMWLRWLDLLGVERTRLGLRLSIHESADVERAERHWSEITGIGADQFSRATLKRHNPKTVRRNTGESYFGCLAIEVRRSRDLYQAIEGWWRGLDAGSNSVTTPW